MKKMRMSCCFLLFFITGILVAQQGDEVSLQERMGEFGLSNDQIVRLMQGQTLTDLSPRNKSEFALFVKNAALSTKMIDIMNKLRPKMSVESLVYLPEAEKANRVDLFNAMLRLSSLSNLQYYQPSKKKTERLMLSATTTDSPNAAAGRADHLLSARPDNFTAYLRQSDDVFGSANYQVDYYSSLDDVAMVVTNVDILKTKGNPLPFAQKGEYTLILQYIPLFPAKGSLLYSAIINKEDPMTFSRDNLISTLASYLDAHREWFVKNFPSRVR
ncbi:MAG: DUF6675 family protein [Spirochaetia bacterium]